MLLKYENGALARTGDVSSAPALDYAEWKEQGGTALRIANDVNLAAEALDLSGVELIVLDFPKYRDGRAFTQARTLRERFGFEGDIRAAGDVLRDQVQFMVRCGFTSFDLSGRVDAGESVVEGFAKSLKDFDLFYQPAVAGVPVWRQRTAAAAGAAARRIA